jgi:hypothetical protein
MMFHLSLMWAEYNRKEPRDFSLDPFLQIPNGCYLFEVVAVWLSPSSAQYI